MRDRTILVITVLIFRLVLILLAFLASLTGQWGIVLIALVEAFFVEVKE